MTIEQWRAAIARWGDTTFGLALLLTGQRRQAEAITIAAFRRTLPATVPAELEHALYRALIQMQRRGRQQLFQRSSLPREVQWIAPADRLLLGLWLLRDLDGAQLSAIFNVPPSQIVTRLEAICAPYVEPNRDADDEADEHVTLHAWLHLKLGLAPHLSAHARVCADCRSAQEAWQATADRLRITLREIVQPLHLPQAAIDAIVAAQDDQHTQDDTIWWQQRRVWLPTLLGVVGIVLALLILPRNTSSSETAAPPTAQALVQQTLDTWTTQPVAGPIRRQVWARTPQLHDGEPVITDVWLGGSGSNAFRVEVRRGGRLVEWQLSDQQTSLAYGAEPSESSCRWNTGWDGNVRVLEQAALRFRLSPDQQRQVREARLTQGAYGIGYLTLQRALNAADLRSFGTRIEGGKQLLVLGYTDTRTQPARQILLRIDPAARQLYLVQEIVTTGTQSAAQEVWRLQLNEQAPSGVPSDLPNSATWVTRDQLLDPACPALKAEYVLNLRTLTSQPWRWYLPQQPPAGMTQAALLGANASPFDHGSMNDTNIIFVGPGRYFALAPAEYGVRDNSPGAIRQGQWQLTITRRTADRIEGTFNLVQTNQSAGPTVQFSAWGMSQDEIAATMGTIEPINMRGVNQLRSFFLDANPLAANVQAVVDRALNAVVPPPGQTLYIAAQTTVRVDPQATDLPDPYHVPLALSAPSNVARRQWIVADEQNIVQIRDQQQLPNGDLFSFRQDDGMQAQWFFGKQGQLITDTSPTYRAYRRTTPLETEMLFDLFQTTDPITITQRAGSAVLEQLTRHPFRPADLQDYRAPVAPTPWMSDLPRGSVIVRRLWIDPLTNLPQRLEISYRAAQGNETLLSTTRITERRALPPASFNFATRPPVPDDVLTVNASKLEQATMGGTPPEPLPRILAWQNSATIKKMWDNAETMPRTITEQPTSPIRWNALEAAPLTRVDQYSIGQNETAVQVAQGPRLWLRYLLRYRTANDNASPPPWDRSARLAVTILGQPREAWLLEQADSGALVIELNDRLIHISGPTALLKDTIVPLLPQLQWADGA